MAGLCVLYRESLAIGGRSFGNLAIGKFDISKRILGMSFFVCVLQSKKQHFNIPNPNRPREQSSSWIRTLKVVKG